MPEAPDDELLAEIEDLATRLAGEAGGLLAGYFGATVEVRYKDEGGTDPVTPADTESEEHISKAVAERYPDHGFLGEEGAEGEDSLSPDFVWVVDPLDGTNNFVGGLPVFACSIGVLYRGAPVVGAVYTPWPGAANGAVVHARRGAGAFVDGERLGPLDVSEEGSGRLATLPGSFRGAFKMGKEMRRNVGEVRVLGSISYEMAMVARGVLRYSVIGGPRLWDVAAGMVIVPEAGGAVRVGRVRQRRWPLPADRLRWDPLTAFVAGWQTGTTRLSELRRWSSPMVVGGPAIVARLAESIAARRRWRPRLRPTLRRRRQR
jgi:myo-inositol-1(or 4)-monophosphatase